MDKDFCIFCGSFFNINKFNLNLDVGDTSKNNVVFCCEDCKGEFLLKIAMNATKVCRDLGLKVNSKGDWKFDNETVKQELNNVRILREENKKLKSDIKMTQDKLNMLVCQHGYDQHYNLKVNEKIVFWDLKKAQYCWSCGNKINWFKREGRYIFICKCGATYVTEIDKMKVTKI